MSVAFGDRAQPDPQPEAPARPRSPNLNAWEEVRRATESKGADERESVSPVGDERRASTSAPNARHISVACAHPRMSVVVLLPITFACVASRPGSVITLRETEKKNERETRFSSEI